MGQGIAAATNRPQVAAERRVSGGPERPADALLRLAIRSTLATGVGEKRAVLVIRVAVVPAKCPAILAGPVRLTSLRGLITHPPPPERVADLVSLLAAPPFPPASRGFPDRHADRRVSGPPPHVARPRGHGDRRRIGGAGPASGVLQIDRHDVRSERSGAASIRADDPRLRVERGGARGLRRRRPVHARRHRPAAGAGHRTGRLPGGRLRDEPGEHTAGRLDHRSRKRPGRGLGPPAGDALRGLRRRGRPSDRRHRLRARTAAGQRHHAAGAGRLPRRHDRPVAGADDRPAHGHARRGTGDAAGRLCDARTRRQPARHAQRPARRCCPARLLPQSPLAGGAPRGGAPRALVHPRPAGHRRTQAHHGLDDALGDGHRGRHQHRDARDRRVPAAAWRGCSRR